jgi:outer membrane protein TolC
MKNKALKNTLCVLIVFCCWVEGYTEERKDSLLSYLEIAAKNNPVVLQRYAEYEAALRKVPQAGSLPDPEISLGIFLSPMEISGGNQVADIRLMQMFPWFGVLKNAKDEMSLMAKARFETFRDAKLQVFFDVERTWYELAKVSQGIRISEKNIELLHTMERLAIVRFSSAPAGSGTVTSGKPASRGASQNSSPGGPGMNNMTASSPSQQESVSSPASNSMPGNSMGSSPNGTGLSDVYRIQIEIGDVQNGINLLKTKIKTLSAQFNSYLDRPSAAMITFPDSLKLEKMNPTIQSVSDSILKKNPMLGMLQLEQQSLEARKQMVTRMGFPMIGLGLNYSVVNKKEMSAQPMNGKDMVMPMITATLPVYRKKYKAMREEAGFLQTANSHNLKATANSLQNEYYQALQSFQDADRRVKLYAGQYQLASKTLEIILTSYSSSSTSLTDVLRLRQQTLDYSNRQTEAIADYNTALAWMRRLGNIEID